MVIFLVSVLVINLCCFFWFIKKRYRYHPMYSCKMG